MTRTFAVARPLDGGPSARARPPRPPSSAPDKVGDDPGDGQERTRPSGYPHARSGEGSREERGRGRAGAPAAVGYRMITRLAWGIVGGRSGVWRMIAQERTRPGKRATPRLVGSGPSRSRKARRPSAPSSMQRGSSSSVTSSSGSPRPDQMAGGPLDGCDLSLSRGTRRAHWVPARSALMGMTGLDQES